MTRRIGRAAACAALAFGLAAGGVRSAFAALTLNYVQDGLVAIWDGIENDGTSGKHLSNLSKWKDCVGDRAFTLTGVTTGDNHLYFTGDGTTSYGVLSYADSPATFDKCAKGTVEIVLDCEGSDTTSCIALHGTIASGMLAGWAASYGCLLLSTDHGGQKGVDINWFNATNTISLLYSSAGVPLRVYKNAEEIALNNVLDCWSGAGLETYIGCNQKGTHGFKGTIHCIRLYSRQLTAEEVAANAAVDRARFSNQPIVVGATFEDVGLNQANVAVRAADGLSLPATVRFVSGLKPDLSDGVEVELGTLTSAAPVTFPVQFARGAKTYCRFVARDATGSLLSSPVDMLPMPDLYSSSYVAEGLVAQWDGIENAGRGTHADTLTGWTDLVGGRSFDFNGAVSVGADGIVFPGETSAYGTMDETDAAAVFGLAATQDVTVDLALTAANGDNAVVLQAPGRVAVGKANKYTVVVSGNQAIGGCHPMDWVWSAGKMNALSVMYSSEGSGDGFVDGSKTDLVSNTDWWTLSGNLATLGGRQSHENSPFAGSVHAVRVYNRRLTAREVAWNALVDRVRFAGDCDVTEAATLRVEYDGDGAACREGVRYWPIPEETVGCATERFVHDADGYTSTCLGWTLYVETGDGVWEEEDSGTGCSMSYSCDDDGRRRLVWHTARSRELPGGYVRLECLESHGQQMIDTGYSPNYQTVLRLDLSYQGTFNSSNPGWCIYGTKTSAEGLRFSCNVNDPGSGLVFWTRYGSDKDSAKQIKTIDKAVRESRNYLFVSMTGGRAEYADKNCGIQARTAAQTQPETIRLFGGGATSDIPFDVYPTMRLYGSYIKDNTTLRHEFIPVRSTKTGARGLYDYVTGNFLTNMVENAADFTGAADAGILVEGDPARIGEPTIPYGWTHLEEGAAFELAEPNAVKFGRKSMHVKSIARYTFDEQTHSWTPAGRTRGSKLTATHTGVPTKYVLEWIPNGLCVIVR